MSGNFSRSKSRMESESHNAIRESEADIAERGNVIAQQLAEFYEAYDV